MPSLDISDNLLILVVILVIALRTARTSRLKLYISFLKSIFKK